MDPYYYWYQQVLQHQQAAQQQATSAATATYTPSASTYGPITQALRTSAASQPYQTAAQDFPPPPPPPSRRTGTLTSPSPNMITPPRHAQGASPSPPDTIPFPQPPIPETWKQTDDNWDANDTGGQKLYKCIRPPARSRNRQIAGLPTFQVFPWLLAYHGTSDYTARSLSNGKFTSLVPTRSIAESIFLTHLIQHIREQHIDLDATAEALHRTAGNVPPAKTTEAKAFAQPLMDILLTALREHAPAPAEGSAIRQLHTREAELSVPKRSFKPMVCSFPRAHLSQPGALPASHLPPAPRHQLQHHQRPNPNR